MPSVEQATRAAIGVGAITTVIGGALAARPEEVAAFGGLQDATGLRTVGIADLALVPGLLAGKPRWPWMAARGALNVAIIAFLLGRPDDADTPKRRVIAGALAGITTQDLRMAAILRRAGR